MDVKSTFLNGIIDQEIYVQQPPGYEFEGKKIKFIGWRKHSMDWSKHLEHGIAESTVTWLRMDFSKATISLPCTQR